MRNLRNLALVWLTSYALTACTGAERVAGTPVAIDFARAHGLVFVDVHGEDGPPLLALLDTGANASAIDQRRAADLPIIDVSESIGTTGSIQVEMVEVDGLRVGSISLPTLRATRRDLSGLLSPDDRPVDMILGSDAFTELVLTLDFVAGRLEISERSSAGPDGVPMILDNGIPAVAATIGGIEMWLRIDTGASLFETPDVYVNIPVRTWKTLRARLPDLAPSTHFTGTGSNGVAVDLPVASVSGAHIGAMSFDSVFVIVQPEAGYFADPEAKGFVSNNYLEKFGSVVLDYRAGRLRRGSSPRSTTR